MTQFRKKPIEISARQVTRETGPDIALWCKGSWHGLYGRGDRGEDLSHVAISTLEGVMRADLGDWVIRGVKGEFYPCKPDIFAATYDPVDGDLPPSSGNADDFTHTVETSRAWMETAAGYARDAEFYRGLVTRIGEMFGASARISDDGVDSGGVLALKVPGLVAEALKAGATWPIQVYERVRHLKRGIEAEVLGEAEVQIATVRLVGEAPGKALLVEGDKLTIYRHDGQLWARFTDEFRDGRFETIEPGEPETRSITLARPHEIEVAAKRLEAVAQMDGRNASMYRELARIMRSRAFLKPLGE